MLRKDSLGAVYRRLAKELHPNLERNPAERERKSRVMQDVTAAYTHGDLHGLLQLEVEWLVSGNQCRQPHFSGDKLRAYTAILKEQATELETKNAVVAAPAAISRPSSSRARSVFRWSSTVRAKWNDSTMIAQIDAALQRLSSDQALTEIRSAIHAVPGTRRGGGRSVDSGARQGSKTRRLSQLTSGSVHAAVGRERRRTLPTKSAPSWR